jgi:hypothetical protein
MKNIFFFISLLLLSSCSNKYEKITYYDDGAINTRKVFEDKSDTTTYYIEQYFPNGNVFQKGHFVKGKTEGIVKQYYENGTLNTSVLFRGGKKNGSQYIFSKNGTLETEDYFEDDIKKLHYEYTDTGYNVYVFYKDKPILNGKVVKSNDSIIRNESYYYHITSKDTLALNDTADIEVEVSFLGLPNRSLEIQLFDKFNMFNDIDKQIFKSDSLKIKFGILPKKHGYALVAGELSVFDESGDLEKKFYLHKLFYIE